MFLVQYRSSGKRGGVDFQDELFEGVWSVEDRVIEGDVDQFINGLGVRICP